jgi:hypothetical protein
VRGNSQARFSGGLGLATAPGYPVQKMMKKGATEDNRPIAEAKELSLDDWLRIVMVPPATREVQLYPDHCFPSESHRDTYLNSIGARNHQEINTLIRRFLIPSGSFGGDSDWLSLAIRSDATAALKIEQVRRALRGEPVWEGITWVIDLLHRPRMAVEVIQAYLTAHFLRMPDWRVNGLLDAASLIRAAYLEPIHPREELLSIGSRDFELVVADLFHRMDYQVSVTRQTSDGGFDVRLRREEAGGIESSIVECKRYTQNVPVKEMRALLGVVERDGLTRGLLVTTSGFTRTTRVEASKTHRIELIDFPSLCVLFNEHFGPEWPRDIDRIISRARLQFEAEHTFPAEASTK